MSEPEVSVVIPALNEADNLGLLLPALKAELAELGVSAEILVVDGGSNDGTREEAAKRGAVVVRQDQPGYGGALRAGFAKSRGPYVLTMDADLSHRPTVVRDLWEARDAADVVIASRYVDGGRAEMGRTRKVLSRLLNVAYRRVLSLAVCDLSSGFRLYRREAVAKLELVAVDFDILEEILVRIHAEGRKITEVPFHYMSRGSGRTHVRLLRFGWAWLRTLIRMWRLRNSVESADYDYRAFDSPIWLQRYWQRARHEVVVSFTGSSDSVLDVGCGSSRIILDLPHAVGMDVSLRKLRWLSARHDRIVGGSCTALPVRAEAFDTVICSEVIEHLPDDPAVLGELGRVLRPGGILVLGTPDYGRWLWWVIEWVYGKVLPGAYAEEHITHFTRRGLESRLRRLGYEILDCRYVGFCEMIFKARKARATAL